MIRGGLAVGMEWYVEHSIPRNLNDASVDTATKLFQNARAEYVEVLLAQRDLQDAKIVLIETKKEQLMAVINAYQALGGGMVRNFELSEFSELGAFSTKDATQEQQSTTNSLNSDKSSSEKTDATNKALSNPASNLGS